MSLHLTVTSINDTLSPQEVCFHGQSNNWHERQYILNLNKSTDKDIIKKLDSQESVEAYLKDLIRKDIAIQTKKPSDMSIEELRKVEEEYNVILRMFKDAAHN